jgi:thiamine biosynthesis lipoprotein
MAAPVTPLPLPVMAAEHDSGFRTMGCDVRLLIGAPLRPGVPAAAAAAAARRERAWLEAFSARLSRFDARSELCALNADPRPEVPASPLLRAAVGAGLWAAELTHGLVDPCLAGALERAGYDSSLDGAAPAPLAEALAAAPPRRPARPAPDSPWRQVAVDGARGTIRRPPGVRLDTGGTGKGLAADAVAQRLAGHARFAIDCGGDIAVGGPRALDDPYLIDVRHPLTGEIAHRVALRRGGIATSGIDARVWRRPDGSFAHHLLDPSTGEPAWTGLAGVTAVGESALEAETLSKQALLLGPGGAERVLARLGGVVVHDDGDVQVVGPIAHERRAGPVAGVPVAA